MSSLNSGSEDVLLRPEQAAEVLGFTPRSLESWRHRLVGRSSCASPRVPSATAVET